MKIGFFVTEVALPNGRGNNVSAHVQIPLHSMKLLRDAGHVVQLITTEFERGEVLPNYMPSGVTVHVVVDPRRKYKGKSRVALSKFLTQLRQIKSIVERERYDVLHFHGSCKLPDMAVFLGLIGVTTPFVATVNDDELPTRFWFIRRRLWKRISAIVTSTEFVRDQLRSRGIPADIVRHGTVRSIKEELTGPTAHEPHRVLFWRDPSMANGADICLAAFRDLAPKFPHISFDVAVRNDHWEDWTTKLKQLAEQFPNVNAYVFPYTSGISLASLLAESICVLLPFRNLSYHPQLSVLESIEFGATVITTPIGSNVELADAGRNALLVPVGDVGATVTAIEEVLNNQKWAHQFARHAAENARAVWNWDSYIPQIIQKYLEATVA